MKVSIIGTGYVGLITGACLADRGHTVVCVDVDIKKVDKINEANSPIHEEGIESLLKRTVNKNLVATTDLYNAVLNTEMTIIAVGTPFDGKEIDLVYVRDVSRQIGSALADKPGYHVVVVKSTVVPGTTDEVVLPLLEESSGKKAGVDFGVGMNPEFLTEGQAVSDFMNPDRIVIGAADERAMRLLDHLYASFSDVPTLRTNNKTAEMIKYASNAMLATQISFANEIGNLCSAFGGIDIVDVMKGVHLSNYLNPKTKDGTRIQAPISSFLVAGCGFGGSCLPKDVKALIAHGEKAGSQMPVLKAVIETNERQPAQLLRLLKKHFSSLKNVRISVLGLAFKPDTDDMRQSPAIPIINALITEGAILKVHDPVANGEARRHLPAGIVFCDDIQDAVISVDAIVLVTRWEQFRVVPEFVNSSNPDVLFIDGRRMMDKHLFKRYEGIGL